jgi:hypothetical protein
VSPGLRVFTDGDGGVKDDSAGAVDDATAFRLSARYDKYDGPAEDVGLSVGVSPTSETSGAVLVHRSMRSCVVSSGRLSSIARPYLARFASAASGPSLRR